MPRARGRPRGFDPEEAVATAQRLFHERGFDAVSVSELTGALGINPPSFYAAFGSKAGLYSRVLDRWTANGAIPLHDILRADRPVAACLADLLEEAARRYAADARATGCLVLEGVRCSDPGARDCAHGRWQAADAMIRGFIAARHPDQAAAVADYVTTTMAGLSARARTGQDVDQLLASARIAALGLTRALEE